MPFSSVYNREARSASELEECSSGFDSVLDRCQIPAAFDFPKPALLNEITLKVDYGKIDVTILWRIRCELTE